MALIDQHNAPVAVVTGAGSGIGRSVAQALLAAGYRVVAAGRREAPLRETLASAAAADRGLAVSADVTDEASVEALFTQTVDAFGRVDLLFNNAGMFGPTAPIGELTLEDWDSVVAVNLTGAFLCARAAFRVMQSQQPQGGRIINNGSISAHSPRPQAAAYTASKHAIAGLTKQLSLEGREFGIACGQIDVGNAATELTDQFSAAALQADGTTAAEPRMEAAQVAAAVVYMAGLPLNANVQSLMVMATKMPFVGRG